MRNGNVYAQAPLLLYWISRHRVRGSKQEGLWMEWAPSGVTRTAFRHLCFSLVFVFTRLGDLFIARR